MQLFQLASYCSVVLCCRVAPLQKAGIVALIKNRTDDMTLAIGDGKCCTLSDGALGVVLSEINLHDK